VWGGARAAGAGGRERGQARRWRAGCCARRDSTVRGSHFRRGARAARAGAPGRRRTRKCWRWASRRKASTSRSPAKSSAPRRASWKFHGTSVRAARVSGAARWAQLQRRCLWRGVGQRTCLDRVVSVRSKPLQTVAPVGSRDAEVVDLSREDADRNAVEQKLVVRDRERRRCDPVPSPGCRIRAALGPAVATARQLLGMQSRPDRKPAAWPHPLRTRHTRQKRRLVCSDLELPMRGSVALAAGSSRADSEPP